MTKLNKILAIVASIILVLNYIEINLGIFVFSENQMLLKLELGLFRIIFSTSLIISYFYLARYFRSLSEWKIETFIYLTSFFMVLSQLAEIFYFIEQSTLELILIFFYVVSFILMFIWGIKVLKLKNSLHKNIRLVKFFVISHLTVLIINSVSTTIFVFSQQMDYLNVILSIYIIPYSILSVFFIKEYKNRPYGIL